MAFEGYEMIFDGVSCFKYDLILCDIGGNKQSETVNFTSAGKLITDKTLKNTSSLLYGTEQSDPLSFNLVLVASPERIENNQPFDRFELQTIASWLSGHNSWKWLKIVQPDLETVRYKCLITELTEITFGNHPWALGCTVTCDSPYAYMTSFSHEYIIGFDKTNFLFRNRSSYNGIYYPKIILSLGTARTIEITNKSNKNNIFKFTNLPDSVNTIVIDNKKQSINSDLGTNIYQYFNFNWFGLIRGDNEISVLGDCALGFTCEFPVNVGA